MKNSMPFKILIFLFLFVKKVTFFHVISYIFHIKPDRPGWETSKTSKPSKARLSCCVKKGLAED